MDHSASDDDDRTTEQATTHHRHPATKTDTNNAQEQPIWHHAEDTPLLVAVEVQHEQHVPISSNNRSHPRWMFATSKHHMSMEEVEEDPITTSTTTGLSKCGKQVCPFQCCGGSISFFNLKQTNSTTKKSCRTLVSIIISLLTSVAVISFLLSSRDHGRHRYHHHGLYGPSSNKIMTVSNSIPIEDAIEKTILVDSDHNIQLWYRTWGNYDSGIPLLFVHGGPGNAIEDYNNGNHRFFDETQFYVIEVDQRGTGKSQPSIRQSIGNMKYYANISIDIICQDFELVRQQENITQWIVWGGSYGSTISLSYCIQYPTTCLTLFLRGIYLDTESEVKAVYTQQAHMNKPHRLREFNILYQYAANYTVASRQQQQSAALDPNDAERLFRLYNEMISTSGDLYAMWHWYVFENNLMEFFSANLLNPYEISDSVQLRKAQSVAFFETTLWLHGVYSKNKTRILERLIQLKSLYSLPATTDTTNVASSPSLKKDSNKIWICQGLLDEVCPSRYAQLLTNELDQYDIPYIARFLPKGGHEDTDPYIEQCLIDSITEFLHQQHTRG